MISLLSFIQTGQFGGISPEATRSEVEFAFGPPPDWGSERQPSNARIWKYGDIEIHFDVDRVWMIFFDHFDIPHMGSIPFDASGIHGQMETLHLEKWLKAHDISFETADYPWCDEGVYFEADSGVKFTLCAKDTGQPAFLCAVSRARR